MLKDVGFYSHVRRARATDHEICRTTNGGNWDMRQDVQMEAIGILAIKDKRSGFSYEFMFSKE